MHCATFSLVDLAIVDFYPKNYFVPSLHEYQEQGMRLHVKKAFRRDDYTFSLLLFYMKSKICETFVLHFPKEN